MMTPYCLNVAADMLNTEVQFLDKKLVAMLLQAHERCLGVETPGYSERGLSSRQVVASIILTWELNKNG